MKERFDLSKVAPDAYKAMYQLEKYLEATTIDRNLRELIRLRASQLNGCAYCIELHAKDALKNGETELRIFALSAWRESPLFTQEERLVLKMTEEITFISNEGLTQGTYEQAKEYFSQPQIGQLIMHIGVINMWNRMAVATHKTHHP